MKVLCGQICVKNFLEVYADNDAQSLIPER